MSTPQININTADEDTLTQLPGIAQALAARIIQYRENVHPFEEVIELAAVPGISERMVRKFEDQITVGAIEAVADIWEFSGEAPAALEWAADTPGEAAEEAEPILSDNGEAATAADLTETAEEPVSPEERDEKADDAGVGEEIAAEGDEAGDLDEIAAESDEIMIVDEIPMEVDEAMVLDEEAADEPLEEMEAELPLLAEPEAAAEEDALPAPALADVEAEEAGAVDEAEATAEAEGTEEILHDEEIAAEGPVVSPQATAGWQRPAPIFEPASTVEATPVTDLPAEGVRQDIDWRGVLIGALLGAGLAFLGLLLVNGGLAFERRAAADARQEIIDEQAATIRNMEAELEALGGSVEATADDSTSRLDALSGDISTLDRSVSEMADTLATNAADIDALRETNAVLEKNTEALEETSAALEEADAAIEKRLDLVAGSAEEFDSFILQLRDLLIGLRGLPEAEGDAGTAATATPAPTSEAEATATPAATEEGAGGARATRTPRPTPTPLTVPTQEP